MDKTIDMQLMRYINLFGKISRVSPKHCFNYNNTLVFAVPKIKVQQAIGPDSSNLRKMSEVIGKKIKVVAIPRGIEDAESFISTIVSPVEIKNIELDGDIMIVNAGGQNKAMLIGRNKSRLDELKKIVKEYFGKEVKIA